VKIVNANLLDSVGSSYDQTRTTVQGRATQKTIDGKSVLGPPLTKFMDFQTDTGGAIMGTTLFASENNRLFIVGAVVAGAAFAPVFLYDFDLATGAHSYVGRINVSIPNNPATTAHSVRSLKVLDVGLTGWKVYLITATTVGPTSHGGTFLVNSVDKADFSQISPPTIPFATGNNQKAVYKICEAPVQTAASVTITVASPGKVQYAFHLFAVNDQVLFTSGTVPTGLILNTVYFVKNPSLNDFELALTAGGTSIVTTGSAGTAILHMSKTEVAAIGAVIDPASNRMYTHSGLAASHAFYVRDMTVAPTYSIASAINITLATPGKVQYAAHPFQANDPIIFTAGIAPGGLALSTVYYVRNPSLNDFEVSLTSAGLSINTTTVGTVDIGRAFGESPSQWLFKTGILPALAGVILATDCENKAIPTNAPINGSLLNGNSCIFLATTTNLYLGLMSELVKGGITWASLTTSNLLGTPNQIVAPTATFASWSDSLDQALYICNTLKVVNKKVQNNVINAIYGQMGITYYEGIVLPTNAQLEFAAAPTNFTNQAGWQFVMGPAVTAGQRGIIALDLRSDCLTDYSYVVSKVMTIPNGQIKNLTVFEELVQTSGTVDIFYRTTGFGSVTGNWIYLDHYQDLSSLSVSGQIQFKITFNVQTAGKSSPIQVSGLLLGYEANEELSDNWEYSYDDSSTSVPTRVGFRLKSAYATSIPTSLRFRAYDLSSTLLISQSITSNPSNFQYSTDGGTTWLSLGTIPNVVGTLVRYNFTSPPGVDVRPSLKDS
jgi:hypothetical protein